MLIVTFCTIISVHDTMWVNLRTSALTSPFPRAANWLPLGRETIRVGWKPIIVRLRNLAQLRKPHPASDARWPACENRRLGLRHRTRRGPASDDSSFGPQRSRSSNWHARLESYRANLRRASAPASNEKGPPSSPASPRTRPPSEPCALIRSAHPAPKKIPAPQPTRPVPQCFQCQAKFCLHSQKRKSMRLNLGELWSQIEMQDS